MARRSWWGWGTEDQALEGSTLDNIAALVWDRLGMGARPLLHPADPSELGLPAPRIAAPAALEHLVSADDYDRAAHTFGKSFRDVVRALERRLPHPPDLVARPRSENDVVALLDWCSETGIACVPYGGGSSVVAGVECDLAGEFPGVVSMDLTSMDRVVEIDRTSRAALIQGGALGPVLEDQLRPHDLTLRHFPQSFEFSTLGGWLATRSGGHYATVYTHIDDLVESMRVVTPRGIVESRRLPGSGAGPSPDRMFLGSEGTLGVITEAWMRVQDRPKWKASASARFATFEAAVDATRAIAQSALFPTNCRLLDAGEAGNAGVTDGRTVLLLGFESADHPVEAWMERALELVADHGGSVPEGVRTKSEEGTAGAWRNSFIRAPYGRDAVARAGAVVETFETACTWDQFASLHEQVTAAATAAVRSATGHPGTVTCRFTHVYPDGPAPYFTVMAPGVPGAQVDIWDTIKAAASDALIAAGGTITHHHAVGRDHRRWYERQAPSTFLDALRAVKRELDPASVLNPGVLFDPRG